jgi:hypothetical protein
LRLAFSKEFNKVGVSFSKLEDGNESSFRNVMFSNYLELWKTDKVHKPSDFENYPDVSMNLELSA